MKMIVPEPAKPGDKIKFVFPSTRCEHAISLLNAVKFLRKQGFIVDMPKLRTMKGFVFAGTDEERANDVMSAFEDPDVKAIIQGRGGVGAVRILDMLNYRTIRKNPKRYIGVSDATYLHLAINKMAGLATYYGSNASSLYWRNYNDEKKYIMKAITGKLDVIKNPKETHAPQTLVPGKVKAPIIGGTLTIVAALMGTKYEIDLKDRILFIEDIAVEPEVIEDYLGQFLLSGKMKRCKGIIFGEFVKCRPIVEDKLGSSKKAYIKEFAERVGVPAIYNFAAGHGKYAATIPFGQTVTFDATQKKIVL